MRTTQILVLTFGALGLATGCEVRATSRPATRLVDAFKADAVEGRLTEERELPPSTEWRFDDEATGAGLEQPEGAEAGTFFELAEGEQAPEPVHGWHALHGIEELRVQDGRLGGRMTEMPILHTIRPEGMEEDDQLYAIELRLRVSSGERLGIGFDDDDQVDLAKFMKGMRKTEQLGLNVDLTAGDELQTVVVTAQDSAFRPSFAIADIRHVFLRIFEAEEGAELELESMRFISRREHLAGIPSGVSWQGCAEIYRETIVGRSPETVHFTLDLPENPWLDLSLGAVEEGALTFLVDLRRGERSSPVHETLLRRTLTTPDRWEPAPLELDRWAGERVTLSFTLEATVDGAIGFWGSPVVRSRGALPGTGGPSEARALLATSDAAPKAPRGVILIITDTLRRDHLEAYGYERSTAPVLSRLASEGALFEDNISQASWTKVSVSSILTSLYPSTHGIVGTPDRLPASVTTLAESFNRAGYATFATSSVPFTGKLTNLHQGLEVLHERSSIDVGGSKTARVYVDRLIEWIELHQDGPFYARLHVFDPHSPFEPRNPYNTMWVDAAAKTRHEELVEEAREVMEESERKRRGMPHLFELEEANIDPDEFTRTELDWYDASIKAMDVEIGRLIERLEELGLADDVLIAVVADHGEEFLEHGEHWHGDTVYGELTNVPLFVRWPGVVPAIVVGETVQSIDLLPTLLDLCSLPVPDEVQGQSLLPLLAANVEPETLGWMSRPAFSEARLSMPRVPKPEEDLECFSIVVDGWRLIHNTTRPDDHPEYELFDHEHDPLNKTNVADANPAVVERLATQLTGWREWAEGERIEEGNAASMTEAELAQLRALGYVR